MPELPEVETVVRDLRPHLLGRIVLGITPSAAKLRRPWRGEWTAQLLGRRFAAIDRRGKWIVVSFDASVRLVVHLGMTGQFFVADPTLPLQDHTHFVFTLDSATQHLRYRDIRRFGSLELFADQAAVTAYLGERLGPEPFDLVLDDFAQAVRQSARPLKAILLDQEIVAGVGNIYADEALFVAGLNPSQRGDRTSRSQAARLRSALIAVLRTAIEARGSTIRNYVGGSGLSGGFQEAFAVYGRTEKPCRACSTPIRRVRLAGRSTHYCPRCQALPRSKG